MPGLPCLGRDTGQLVVSNWVFLHRLLFFGLFSFLFLIKLPLPQPTHFLTFTLPILAPIPLGGEAASSSVVFSCLLRLNHDTQSSFPCPFSTSPISGWNYPTSSCSSWQPQPFDQLFDRPPCPTPHVHSRLSAALPAQPRRAAGPPGRHTASPSSRPERPPTATAAILRRGGGSSPRQGSPARLPAAAAVRGLSPPAPSPVGHSLLPPLPPQLQRQAVGLCPPPLAAFPHAAAGPRPARKPRRPRRLGGIMAAERPAEA